MQCACTARAQHQLGVQNALLPKLREKQQHMHMLQVLQSQLQPPQRQPLQQQRHQERVVTVT
jgi:hypothetical protein